MYTDSDLIRLVAQGFETKDVEYKGTMGWDEADKKASCELVKDILAIANTKGGIIVIGVDEVNSQFSYTGLSEEQVKSFESTRLANFIQRYADPPINTTVRPIPMDKRVFVVIQIPQFPTVPHICIKEYPGVLSSPTLYVRTDKNESAPVPTSSDLRSLLISGVRKQTDELLTSIRALLTGPTVVGAQSASDQFAEQYAEGMRAFTKTGVFANENYEGFRVICTHPAEFNRKRFELPQLREAMYYASRNHRGWPLLPVDPTIGHDTYRIVDGYETLVVAKDFLGHDSLDFWQLHQSGLLYLRRLMVEDTAAGQKQNSAVLDVNMTVAHVAEAVEVLVLLYLSLDVPADEEITLQIHYTGTNNRQLVTDKPIGFLRSYVSRMESIHVSRSYALAEWRAGLKDHAAEIAANLFQKFNWEGASPHNFLPDIEHLLSQQF